MAWEVKCGVVTFGQARDEAKTGRFAWACSSQSILRSGPLKENYSLQQVTDFHRWFVPPFDHGDSLTANVLPYSEL
jgi:hypothetical protein